ncbi:MAG: glycosyltransferase family 2 protein [Bacteroidota bacterium]
MKKNCNENIFWFREKEKQFLSSGETEMPKLSIIIPTLNQGVFIEDTLCSVIHQNYPNIEIIVVDGGSTDNTLEILSRYKEHIPILISEADKGQAEAVNKGLRKASGEIIIWINSDDFFTKDAFHTIAKTFNEHADINCVCAREIRIDFKDKIANYSFGSTVHEKPEDNIVYAHIDQPSTFFRRSVFDKVGLLNESLQFFLDTEFWIRYLLHFSSEQIISIPDRVVVFRYHKGSKTISSLPRFFEEGKLILTEIARASGGNNEILQSIQSTTSHTYRFTERALLSKINANRLVILIEKKYSGYSNDPSRIYLETGNFFYYMNLKSVALVYLRRAICIRPLKFLNYKTFVKALLFSPGA